MHRKVHKTYVALVIGVIAADAGTLDKPIGESLDPESCLVTTHADAVNPRSAITHFRVLERFANHTLVEAKPVTGRHHQIRVHFADIGHPVVDDEFYGPYGWIKKGPDGQPISLPAESRKPKADRRNTVFTADEDEITPDIPPELLLVGRHALHAHRIEFRHPITWEPLAFEAPLTDDIARVVERLRVANVAVIAPRDEPNALSALIRNSAHHAER